LHNASTDVRQTTYTVEEARQDMAELLALALQVLPTADLAAQAPDIAFQIASLGVIPAQAGIQIKRQIFHALRWSCASSTIVHNRRHCCRPRTA